LDPDPVLTPTRRRSWLALLPVLLPLSWFLFTGARGIDFGVHWDEHRQLPVLQRMHDEGTLLPGNYWYGSVIHLLGAATAAPELASGWENAAAGEEAEAEADAAFARFLASDAFRFRLRTVFLVVTGLGIVWLYLAALAAGGSVWMALAAACWLGLSWEFAYHARWPLPDGVTTQFAALTLLGLVLASRRASQAWLLFAALAAGLATGTKYPAGMLLVPVLLSAWFVGRGAAPVARLRLFAVAGFVFAASYLVTTPGTLLEPARFWEDVSLMVNWYGERGHGVYTVVPGWEHATREAEYVGLVLFSRWPVAAALGIAFALVGVGALLRSRPSLALVLLAFPLLHLVYMSTQKAMIVRNLLPIAPFLAFFVARGIAALWGGVRTRGARGLLAVVAVGPLLANGAWLSVAADSVAHRHDEARFLREMTAHVEARAEQLFHLSPRVAADLATFGIDRPKNAVTGGGTDGAPDRFVLYASDAGGYWALPSNRRRLTETWFGPYEVNYDYYTSWWGDDRILVLDPERLSELGLDDVPSRAVEELQFFEQGWMLQKIGENDGAIRRYRRAVREHPDHVQTWFNLAYALMETGEHREAVRAFERTLELKPDYHDARWHMGTCLDALGETERAAAERALFEASRQ
jgi:hypothetical protein